MLRRLGLASLLCLTAAPAWAGTTEIVVQWMHRVDWPRVQTVLDQHARAAGYETDGNDVGAGSMNFRLYAPDESVDSVVSQLVAMEERHQLPPGVRIGIAVSKDGPHHAWTWRAAYPPGLKTFAIIYPLK